MKLVKVGCFWINPDRVNAVIDDVNTEGVVFIDIGSKDIYYSIPNRTVDEVAAFLEGKADEQVLRCTKCGVGFLHIADSAGHRCSGKDNEVSDG